MIEERFQNNRGNARSHMASPKKLPAILQLSKPRHRQLAVKWAFGRFPPLSTSLLEEKFGEKIPANLNTLKTLLSRYRLSEEERTAAEASLDQLLFMTSTYFDDLE